MYVDRGDSLFPSFLFFFFVRSVSDTSVSEAVAVCVYVDRGDSLLAFLCEECVSYFSV